MATFSLSYVSGESDIARISWLRYFGLNTWQSRVRDNIPKYSTINSVTLYDEVKRGGSSLSSSNTDYTVYFTSEMGEVTDAVEFYNNKSSITNSYKGFSVPLLDYTASNTATAGEISYGSMNYLMIQYHGTIARYYYYQNTKVTWDYTPPTYTISTKSSGGGSVSGGGTFDLTVADQTKTITATPNSGYKFVKWVDSSGNTYNTSSLNIVLSHNNISAHATSVTYTAYFEIDKTYVTYDNIFNFKKWAENNLTSWQFMNIYNVTDTGFTGTALVDDAYTQECRPIIPVVAGKEYILEVDVETNVGFQLFVFFCDANGAWGNLAYGPSQKTVVFTPTTNYISIRCDIDGTGNVGTFSNFRIYPADCPYMGSTVSATERTDINGWSMPTPTREGYRFLGWFTQPNGGGVQYTSSSAFPTGGADLVLYSHWEIAKINKIYIGTSQPKAIYIGTQEVKEVYVGTTKVYG